MTRQILPDYADFDNYRYMQWVVVTIRWIIFAFWMGLRHYNAAYDFDQVQLDIIGGALFAMNVWLHYRLWKKRPVGRSTVMAASLVDLIAISIGLALTTGFVNSFYILYYPALIGMALVVSSTVTGTLIVTLTAAAYAVISMLIEPGIRVDLGMEKVLIMRIVVMYSSVLVAYLVMRVERSRRREAVEHERDEAARNLELRNIAQQTELRAAEQRFRISREIHDGIAQNLYGLTLNLESAVDAARSGDLEATVEKLTALVPLAKQSLLETRHYMHDLRPLLGAGGDLCKSVENLAEEFETISGIKVDVTVHGERVRVAEERAAQVCRIVQESLANVLRHSGASEVSIVLAYADGRVEMQISDNGNGFDTAATSPGFGLDNIRSRATEISAKVDIISSPGNGTTVSLAAPVAG